MVLCSVTLRLLAFCFFVSLATVNADCVSWRYNLEVPPKDDQVTRSFISNRSDWIQLNVPPRYMWGWGDVLPGYCGAASWQSAALFFGSWISQEYPMYAIRALRWIEAGNVTDDFDRLSREFALDITHFPTYKTPGPQPDQFLQWIYEHLVEGHPVIGTLYSKIWNTEADPDYDHIVPIVGLTMDNHLRSYSDNGVTNITGVLFNDLGIPMTRVLDFPLAADRRDVLMPNILRAVQPISYAFPFDTDYGIAMTGVTDEYDETYWTKLTAWSWTEPDWGQEDECFELPEILNLSIAVHNLTAGVTYSILRFDGNRSIPTSRFLAAPYTERWDFVATGPVYVVSPFDTIRTDTVVSYRTVRTEATLPPPNTTEASYSMSNKGVRLEGTAHRHGGTVQWSTLLLPLVGVVVLVAASAAVKRLRWIQPPPHDDLACVGYRDMAHR